MANLKVFVSSTCYDLHAIRAQLKSTLISMGYEPVMSDQADVIYDPRIHTHTSCLREVENCDIVVLLIGSRFGGAIVPKAAELLELDRLADLSRADRFGEDKTKISITQAEVLRAIQTGLPVFAFVDSGVMRDHLTYEKNKNKPIINQIEFSSIDKSDTAPYIFEFINFLRLRNENNSIFDFSRFEDIESQLKKQWAGLFQRLLYEQRTRSIEGRRIENLSGQIADLKAAVLGSISSRELKETAKGAIRFRLMIDVISSLGYEYCLADTVSLMHSDISWEDLMSRLGIIEVRADNSRSRYGSIGPGTVLIRVDDTHYRMRQSLRIFSRLAREWEEFRKLGEDARDAILNAVLDSRDGRPMVMVKHYNEPYVEDAPPVADDEVESDFRTTDELLSNNSRILLTADKFIEETIKNYLSSESIFENMNFLVDANDGKLKVDRLSGSKAGPVETFSYVYEVPKDGNLGPLLEELKASIRCELHGAGQSSKDTT